MLDHTRQSQRIVKDVVQRNADGSSLDIRGLIEQKNRELLEHRYFRMCRTRAIDRARMLDVVKQLYCFSVYFERILAQRITECSSGSDPEILAIARAHMREEIGHAELFRECLEANGTSRSEVHSLEPALFTKAMFGYLTVTIQHENEYVSNVVIMQVMESIGYHFFSETLRMLQAHSMVAEAMLQHSEDDMEHANLGADLIGSFDEATARDCRRTINDIYRLMPLVFDEWLGLNQDEEAITLDATG